MTYAECVPLAFLHIREATDSALLAQSAEFFPSTGQYLMGISLMPYIYHEFIVRGVIHIMHAHYQFDGSQAGCQMARIIRTNLHHIGANLRTQLAKLIHIKAFNI